MVVEFLVDYRFSAKDSFTQTKLQVWLHYKIHMVNHNPLLTPALLLILTFVIILVPMHSYRPRVGDIHACAPVTMHCSPQPTASTWVGLALRSGTSNPCQMTDNSSPTLVFIPTTFATKNNWYKELRTYEDPFNVYHQRQALLAL